MEHCVELLRAGTQPTMPLLGQFCIQKMGLQMKVGGGGTKRTGLVPLLNPHGGMGGRGMAALAEPACSHALCPAWPVRAWGVSPRPATPAAAAGPAGGIPGPAAPAVHRL